MTTTLFYNPQSIQNVSSYNEVTATPSIDWQFNQIIAQGNYATSSKPLYSMSGFWQERFRTVTSELWLTELGIPNNGGNVVGIEFQLNILRAARIEDLTIQLTIGGQLIGDNYASVVNPVQSDTYTAEITIPQNPVGDYNIYGGPADLWGTTGLTSANIADPTFGVVISFQSNVIYPHKDTAYVDQVGVRITYA
jgi:hypothetical protein